MDVLKNQQEDWDDSKYPFNLAAVKSWETLQLHEKVTFFVGENGSGKSTLIESIAIAAGLNAEGGNRDHRHSSQNTHSCLNNHIRLAKSPKQPKDSYFLRAESFYTHASFIDNVANIGRYGGRSIHQQSHGEGMMSLFWNRFDKNGLYILDEPEAALSPARQLSFIARLHALVTQNCQFIIATHSPILLAYPNALIYECSDVGIQRVNWDDIDHVNLTRQFLNHPKKYLDILMEDEE